jgi:DNA modification methylase
MPEITNQILTGDCLEIMKKIKTETVSLVITSPPYNLALDYDKYEDNLSHEDYLKWMKKVWLECKRILRKGGRLIINIAPTGISKFVPIHIDFVNICREIGLTYRAEIIWYKQTIRNRTAWGSWKSPRNPHVLPSWEYILVFQKDQPNLDGDSNKIDITAEEFKNWSDAYWYIPPETQRKGHPAPFPEELIKRLIKFYSYQDDIILDPFGGTGTTAFVAKKFGRQFIHIDVSEDYNKVAIERLRNLSDKGLFEIEKPIKNLVKIIPKDQFESELTALIPEKYRAKK